MLKIHKKKQRQRNSFYGFRHKVWRTFSKVEFLLAFIGGVGSFAIFFGFMGSSFVVLDKWNLLISSMFFIIPSMFILALFKIFRLESTSTPDKGYSY